MMANFPKLKQLLIAHCTTLLEQRILVAETAMKNAQESANSEDKSSAGDKYETSRAMGHLDRDMNAKQLLVAKKELAELLNINPETSCVTPIKGALVQTNLAYFFIAIGVGLVKINELTVGVISPISPIALQLKNKQQGDTIIVAGKQQTIIVVG